MYSPLITQIKIAFPFVNTTDYSRVQTTHEIFFVKQRTINTRSVINKIISARRIIFCSLNSDQSFSLFLFYWGKGLQNELDSPSLLFTKCFKFNFVFQFVLIDIFPT